MSGTVAFERMLNDIADTFEREFGDCGDVDGFTVYTDDVEDAGVFVAGEGQCGRVPVRELHDACRRSEKRGDRSILTGVIHLHVG